MLTRRCLACIFVIATSVLSAGVVYGQEYPSKPIRIITSAPGGGSDFASRIIAQGIAEPLGQQVIVDNRPGFISAEVVSKSPPDGYSLHVGGSTFLILPILYGSKIPYDPIRDFAPVTLISKDAAMLVVHPSLPVKTVKELIVLAKGKPGELNYGTGSIGGVNHLATELFGFMAGIKLTHISYKGAALAITGLLGGESQVQINDIGLLMRHVKVGRLRGIAVTSAEPSALAPGLPAVAATLPGFESVALTGFWVPARTPPSIVNRLNQEIVRVLNRPDVQEKFLNAGSEVAANSAAQFDSIIKAEMSKISKIIKDANIKVEQ